MRIWIPVLVVVAVLAADQALKLWVMNNMVRGEDIVVADPWFILHYTLNYGIAFGLEFGARTGKVVLSLFRILALGFIGYYLMHIVRKNFSIGFLVAVAMIFAGALGNIIDSVFYGVLFQGDTWLHGRVVDMFYFPLIDTVLPPWLPIWGGERFVFFRPVFNIADAAISIGVALILLFYRKEFAQTYTKPAEQ